MNLISIFKTAVQAAKDPERRFSERIFLIFCLMSEITVSIALVGDILTGENPYEILVIAAILIFMPVLSLACLLRDRLKLAIRLLVIGLLFIINPALFFFGGGLEGGGVLWIIFSFMYTGLLLRGRWRKIMFCAIAVMTFICFVTAYFHPELVYQHTRSMYYVDFFISLMLVGVLCYFMTWTQGRLFHEENLRAKDAAKNAEELKKSQNRFFSNMSHEIRTPINSILGLNELILRDQSASDEIVRDATGIQGSGKMLLSLINDILDFSKIESGSMDIVPVDYKTADLLSEIVNMMWLRANEKGLSFEISIDPDVPSVLYGDEVRIKQIIVNLLNNAVKYTEEGHVELRVESIAIPPDKTELVISVTDTGAGIRKDDIPYLFDAFKRVDEDKNRHIEGTGLGLSIVKQLAELMDGSVTVNSVYGEGSTFTVSIKQLVSGPEKIGEIDLKNKQAVRRKKYESSFLAPEARILIVDDNELNLEVERRLLEDTDMAIDTAKSGKEALEMSLKLHYDAIFMDHLMPEMDGVECLEKLRYQSGGLNRTTPVIVLTANAGSENRELYRRSGFDGYLVKPVSGEAMEEILIQYISGEKIILKNQMMRSGSDIHTSARHILKAPVIITSTSMCDLPDSVVRRLHIPLLPFNVTTDEGVFRDGVHMDANELIRHISSGKNAVSSPPDETEYAKFFSENLKKAHHLIHISLTTSLSQDHQIACEAAKGFDNVTVVNSECISSSTGILVLIAYKLAQQGVPVKELLAELETIKRRLKCSFIIDTTEYMAKKGLIGQRLHRIASLLNLHPALRIKNDRAMLDGIWLGRTKRAYGRYISRAIPADTVPDSDVVFITYVDVPAETLSWVEQEVRKKAYFEHVVFQQASAAISSNCGPGTCSILYLLKSNKSYNIGSYLEEVISEGRAETENGSNDETLEDVKENDVTEPETPEIKEAEASTEASDTELPDVKETDDEPSSEDQWYHRIDCLDIKAALKNSGSSEALYSVLKIFYDSIDEKHQELSGYYSSEDWASYTIKIHALKSSSRIVGAFKLGDMAERLEDAGKENDTEYIREHHEEAMEEYMGFKEALAFVFEEKTEKPLADSYLMEGIYEGLIEAANAMDCDMVEGIMKEISAYETAPEEKERFELVKEKADLLDYDGIIETIGKKG